MYKNGIGIYTISKHLGHSDIGITTRYLGISEEDFQEAVDSLVMDVVDEDFVTQFITSGITIRNKLLLSTTEIRT